LKDVWKRILKRDGQLKDCFNILLSHK